MMDKVTEYLKQIDEAEQFVRALQDHPGVGVGGMTTIAIRDAIDAFRDLRVALAEYPPVEL